MPTGRTATALAAALGAVALLLAGCGGGGGGKPAALPVYTRQVNAVASKLDAATNNLGDLSSASAAAAELATAQTALRTAAKRLDAITPPRAVKTEHERLVRAVGEIAVELTPLIRKLKDGHLDALGDALQFKGVTEAEAAIAAITKAGYKIRIPLINGE
jgi:hypothetical protein